MTYGIASQRDALPSSPRSTITTIDDRPPAPWPPKRKATRKPTMEWPRTRAQVQRRGPSSPHMNTRESSELSTPPREEPEPEPHQEEMDTGDSPTRELQDSQQQSGSETGPEVRMRSVPGVAGRCRSCPPLIGKRARYSSNALLWWAETGRVMFPRLTMMAKDYYATQRKPSVYSGCVDADPAI
jgi:hypothetical protein